MNRVISCLLCVWLLLLVLTAAIAGCSPAAPVPTSVLPAATDIPLTPPATTAPNSTASLTPTLPPAITPTFTPAPTLAPPTSTHTLTPTPCLDKARFVSETIPDDTYFRGGATFKKSWILDNNGTCTWGAGYRLHLVRTDGLQPVGEDSISLPEVVVPGGRVTLVFELKVPAADGTYRADFQLVNDRGVTFGIGPSATAPVYVRIVAHTSPSQAGVTQPVTQPGGCTYQAAFVKETVPDNSKFFTGEIFSKSWTVKNTGTCTWEGIRLPWVKDGGLNFPPGVPRADNPHGDVPPGDTFTLGWPIITPAKAGTYRADFLLAVHDGTQFGLGKDGKTPLYVQIVAVEGPSPLNESDLNLPTPDLKDTFDKNDPAWWKPSPGGIVEASITNGSLLLRAKQKTYFWTVRAMPLIRGHVSQAVFQTGESCTGSNAFGLMVGLDSASNPKNGHLLRLTCDGRYSVVFMDQRNEPKTLIPETAHPAVLAGPNQVNRASIISTGGRMSFYINGVKVADLNFAGGNTDFQATQYENGAVTGQFLVDMSQFFYTDIPFNDAGMPGLYLESTGPFSLWVEEFSFWNLESLVK